MLHQIRRQLRTLAATVLVLVSALGAWSTVAHDLDCHDSDGAPVLVVHDASAHAFRTTTPPDSQRPVHCVLCHWTRTFGPGAQSVSVAPVAVSRSLALPARETSPARLVAAAQPPLRAPPSAPLLAFLA